MNPQIESATICLVQLTRIGDVLQTLQSAWNIKQEHPNLRLIFIGREEFAKPVEFLLKQKFDRIYYLNFKNFFKKPGITVDKIIYGLDEFVDEVNNENIDVAINLTFSKSSSYLMALIKAKFKLGLKNDTKSILRVNDHWSQYIYSTVQTGPHNPFSLVDLYRYIIGGQKGPKFARTVKNPKKVIGVHPFASTSKKSWDHIHWAYCLNDILNRNPEHKIYLFGSPKEWKESQTIIEHNVLKTNKDRIINYVAQTSIEDLSNLISQCKIFIGHDSMCGHLASIHGVQTLTLALGTVRPHETTPYGCNNYVLAPNTNCYPCFPDETCVNFECHQDIPIDVVGQCVQQMIYSGTVDLEKIDLKNTQYQFRLFSSEIFNDQLFYLNQLNSTGGFQQLVKNIYQIIWSFTFNNIDLTAQVDHISQDTYYKMKNFSKGIEHLYEVFNFGIKYSDYLVKELSTKNPNFKKVKEFSKKLQEVENLEANLANTFLELAPVINYYRLTRANITNEPLLDIARETFNLYEQSSNILSALHSLTDSIITKFSKDYDLRTKNVSSN